LLFQRPGTPAVAFSAPKTRTRGKRKNNDYLCLPKTVNKFTAKFGGKWKNREREFFIASWFADLWQNAMSTTLA